MNSVKVFFSNSGAVRKLASVGTVILAMGLAGVSPAYAQSGWTQIAPTDLHPVMFSVKYINVDTGIVVGQNNLILWTTNRGATWNNQTMPASYSLKDVAFSSSTNVVAVGDSGNILQSTDGGIIWTSRPSGTTNNLLAVRFADANTGFAVGTNGTILKTTNGGYNWLSLKSGLGTGNGTTLFAIVTITTQSIVVAGQWRIIATQNGGTTWQTQFLDSNYTFYGIAFTKPSKEFVIGGNGIVMYTTNAGINWDSVNLSASDNLYSISFPTPGFGYIVGINNDGVSYNNIFYTTNGGNTWTTQDEGFNLCHCVYFADRLHGAIAYEDWSTSSQGFLFETSDGGNSWLRSHIEYKDNLNSFFSLDTMNAIAVGNNRTIIRTSDGGTNWTEQMSSLPIALRSVFFSKKYFGIAVGDSGTILATKDSGYHWSEQMSNTKEQLNGVFLVSNSVGYIVGTNGTILQTTNAGVVWTTQYSGTTKNLSSVWFTTDSNGYAVGDSGLILVTTNAGLTWRVINSSILEGLTKVRFSDVNTGMVVGRHGIVLRTSDGGVTWIKLTSGITNDLYSLSYAGNNTWYAGGTLGSLIKITNNGKFCLRLNNINMHNIFCMNFTDPQNGIIAGDSGYIAKTSTGGLFSYWQNQNLYPSTDNYIAFHYKSLDTQYIAGNNEILSTTDAGDHWSIQTIPYAGINNDYNDYSLRDNIHQFQFINDTDWTFVSEGDSILRTSDAGMHWNLQYVYDTNQLLTIYFYNNNLGWAAGNNGDIIKTTNGGKTWAKYMNNTFATYDMHFFSPYTGISVGIGGSGITRTTDAGKTWIYSTSSEQQPPYEYSTSFIDSLRGFCFGQFMLWTTDAGITWYHDSINTISDPNIINYADYKMKILDNNTAFLVGDGGTIWKSNNINDVGKKPINWSLCNSNTVDGLIDIEFYNDSIGTAVGVNGAMVKTSDGGITWHNANRLTSNNLTSVSCPDAITAYIVGAKGTITHTTNAGITWVNNSNITPNDLLSTYFINDSIGMAVGMHGTILSTTNEGIDWLNISKNTINYNGVFMTDSNTATIVGDSGSIFHTTNSGLAWENIGLGTKTTLNSIYYLDNNTAIVVGNAGLIGKTTNAGVTWTIEKNITNFNIVSVVFSSKSIVYAVANGYDTIYIDGSHHFPQPVNAYDIIRSTDGGNDWTLEYNVQSGYCHGISFADSLYGWIVGDAFVLQTTNGGITWTTADNAPATLNGISMINNTGYAVGDNGTILRLSLEGPAFAPNTRNLDFGKMYQNASMTKNITVCNPGDTTLWINQIISTNPRFTFTTQNASIDSDQRFNFPITIKTDTSIPGEVIPYSGYIIFYSNAITSPDSIKVTGNVISGVKEIANAIPGSFVLDQNYPDPFNSFTNISFSLPRQSQVKLCVYNILGSPVATLAVGTMAAGAYTANFDASTLPEGVYFYSLVAGQNRAVREMAVEK